jgi:hypothetical protein
MNDTERLVVATKLGFAIAWRSIAKAWGKFWGTITGLYLCIEHVPIIRRALGCRHVFKRNRKTSACDDSVKGHHFLDVTPFCGMKKNYVKRVNAQAELFFNGGNQPPKLKSSINEVH